MAGEERIGRGSALALVAMALAVFVLAIDFAAINVAIRQLEHDFDTDVTTTQWVVNAYALTFGVLLVTGGRLADGGAVITEAGNDPNVRRSSTSRPSCRTRASR